MNYSNPCLIFALAFLIPFHLTIRAQQSTQEMVQKTVLQTSIGLIVGSALGYVGPRIIKAVHHYIENRRQSSQSSPITSFKHVAGSIPEEIVTLVDMFNNPQPYAKLNIPMPCGILFFGPSGTGKTLLARAIAGELRCPFFYKSGSHFVNMFAGVGAQTVRTLFAQARTAAEKHPRKMAVIFIDELDAIGAKRIDALDGASTERNQTLNQLLIEMDGFEHQKSHIIVIGATNMLKLLDPALVRPGRFDEIVELGLPALQARKALLQFYIQKHPYEKTIDIEYLAQHTEHFSQAQIKNLVHKAALHAAKHHHNIVEYSDLYSALANTKKT